LENTANYLFSCVVINNRNLTKKIMNRDILKITSMLFLGLTLATSCSKGPKTEEAKKTEETTKKGETTKKPVDAIKDVLTHAREAREEIENFDTVTNSTNFPDVTTVFNAAKPLLEAVQKEAEAAEKEANTKAKVEITKAITALKNYLTQTQRKGVNAAGEQTEAGKVAVEVIKALNDAIKVS
jgi:hypothetical protein